MGGLQNNLFHGVSPDGLKALVRPKAMTFNRSASYTTPRIAQSHKHSGLICPDGGPNRNSRRKKTPDFSEVLFEFGGGGEIRTHG